MIYKCYHINRLQAEIKDTEDNNHVFIRQIFKINSNKRNGLEGQDSCFR